MQPNKMQVTSLDKCRVQKLNVMKRKKLTLIKDIPTYYHFCKGTFEGNEGYFYYLVSRLSDSDKHRLRDSYNNVVILNLQKEFAPEIKTHIIFVSNKVIK